MVKLTLIARVRDGQLLAEGLDGEKENGLHAYKQQAKAGGGMGRAASSGVVIPRPRTRTQRVPASFLWQTLFKQFGSAKPPPRQSIASGDMVFHTLVDEYGVCYLVLTDKGYPKKLAYQYLEELQSEFSRLYGTQIESVNRPYAFIKFGALGGGPMRPTGGVLRHK